MNYLSVLEVFAELAIAIVGFGGIVVALQADRLSTDGFARIRLSILLGYGAGGILWSLLPLIILTPGRVDETLVWQFCSLTFLAMMLAFAAYRMWQAKLAANNINFAGPIFPIAAFSQMSVLGVNVYFASAQLFLIALLSNLCIGVYIFWLLLRGSVDNEPPGSAPVPGARE